MLNKRKASRVLKKINIAIDGLSSTGKSSLAKAVAHELGYTYIDSGAMYRAIALYFLNNQLEISENNGALQDALAKIKLRFENQHMMLNDVDVEDEIRGMQISGIVSEVAALPIVRDFSVRQQQAYGKEKGVVMDGRDIGTVVFPDAELKIFLCASEDVRVQRRYEELVSKGKNISISEVKQNLLHRDKIDTTRAYNPLRKAVDARELDNSALDIPGQVALIKKWVAKLI